MEKGIFTRFFNLIARDDKGMKPILLKCGLALALTFAGFLFSHFRTKRIKPSPKGPSSGHASEVNSRTISASSSFCNIHSEGNNLEYVSYLRKYYLSDCFFIYLIFADRIECKFLFIILYTNLNSRIIIIL